MSSRPLLTPYTLLDAHTMGASFSSDATILSNLSMISYEASWANGSTPVGVLAVEVSNSYSLNSDGSVRNAGTWTVITSSAVSGNTGAIFFDVAATAGYATRLTYTRTSGSGALSAIVTGKVS